MRKSTRRDRVRVVRGPLRGAEGLLCREEEAHMLIDFSDLELGLYGRFPKDSLQLMTEPALDTDTIQRTNQAVDICLALCGTGPTPSLLPLNDYLDELSESPDWTAPEIDLIRSVVASVIRARRSHADA